MRNYLRIKKLTCLLVSLCLILGNTGIYSYADEQPKQMKVKVVGTSNDFLSGYYVVYDINGTKFRSDEVGPSFNDSAWKLLSMEDKKKTLMTFAFAPRYLKSQFLNVEQMNREINEAEGWIDASKILGDRIAQKNFPELEKKLGENSDVWYQENYSSIEGISRSLGSNIETETKFNLKKKIGELPYLFDIAKTAYGKARLLKIKQTKLAVTSLSGEIIKMITDKALVPVITVSGTAGLSKDIALEVFEYFDNLTGMSDSIQQKVVDQRLGPSDVSQIINDMANMMDTNIKLAEFCLNNMENLKSEIENDYNQFKKEIEEQEKQYSNRKEERSEILREHEAKLKIDDYDAEIVEKVATLREQFSKLAHEIYDINSRPGMYIPDYNNSNEKQKLLKALIEKKQNKQKKLANEFKNIFVPYAINIGEKYDKFLSNYPTHKSMDSIKDILSSTPYYDREFVNKLLSGSFSSSLLTDDKVIEIESNANNAIKQLQGKIEKYKEYCDKVDELPDLDYSTYESIAKGYRTLYLILRYNIREYNENLPEYKKAMECCNKINLEKIGPLMTRVVELKMDGQDIKQSEKNFQEKISLIHQELTILNEKHNFRKNKFDEVVDLYNSTAEEFKNYSESYDSAIQELKEFADDLPDFVKAQADQPYAGFIDVLKHRSENPILYDELKPLQLNPDAYEAAISGKRGELQPLIKKERVIRNKIEEYRIKTANAASTLRILSSYKTLPPELSNSLTDVSMGDRYYIMSRSGHEKFEPHNYKDVTNLNKLYRDFAGGYKLQL